MPGPAADPAAARGERRHARGRAPARRGRGRGARVGHARPAGDRGREPVRPGTAAAAGRRGRIGQRAGAAAGAVWRRRALLGVGAGACGGSSWCCPRHMGRQPRSSGTGRRPGSRRGTKRTKRTKTRIKPLRVLRAASCLRRRRRGSWQYDCGCRRLTVMNETPPLKVIVVDDEPLARRSCGSTSAPHPGVEVVAECANGFEAVKAVTRAGARPDVPGRADAQAERVRGPRADRPRRAGDLHHRLRPVRAAGVRGARGRLPAEAVRATSGWRKRWRGPAARLRRRRPTRPRRWRRRRGRAARRSSGCWCATARSVHVAARSSASTTSRRRTTTSCFKAGGQAVPQGPDDGRAGGGSSTRRGSSASTAPTCSTSNGSPRVELYAKDSRVAVLARRHAAAGEPRRVRAAGQAPLAHGARPWGGVPPRRRGPRPDLTIPATRN